MFLRRIQVPNFRVLKDVDITFEPEFNPRIFPLGSLNGGGKSTLLQLVFILLSCSGDSEKHSFIRNMLEDFTIGKDENQKLLAAMHLLLHKDSEIELNFYCYKNKTCRERAELEENDKEFDELEIDFSILDKDEKLKQDISKLQDEIKSLAIESDKLKRIQSIVDAEERQIAIKKELDNIKDGSLFSFIHSIFTRIRNTENINISSYVFIDSILRNIRGKIETCSKDIEDKKLELEESEFRINKVFNYLENNDIVHICNFRSLENYALLCNSKQLNTSEIKNLLWRLVNQIFLSAPFTQVFLFVPRNISELLFKDSKNKYNYYFKLNNIKKNLANFFTYDLLSVDFIIDSFKEARDKDFKQAIESGEYGDAYKSLLNELNSILNNKKINLDSDLSGVNFKIEINGKSKELYPEDLSHGELKRLSIYIWLKHKQIENAIVLMDEIENAFHPDWQYQIISDLAEWGASNQYILATHSYELCQALTPAHVKELEPKLLASDKEN